MVKAMAWFREWWRYLRDIPTQLWGNPVVGREVRVRVRVGRSYLLQSLYLGFLILITLLAYANVVSERVGRNPFSAQQYLQTFHGVVMGTLTALIVLIAPGLTANAITLERERRTIDLLVATPLTARQLLTGKLVGSFAFIVLLLALALPISGVSLLLGGTTFQELLETYLLIALSAMVISAIALFSSVYARSSTVAVFWSYLRVGLFVGVLGITTAFQAEWRLGGLPGSTGRELIFPIAALSPFSAPYIADTFVPIMGSELPGVLVGALFCLMATRLLLTGAAFKVGLYGKDTLPSLRRQMLLFVFLLALLNTMPLFRFAGGVGLGASVEPTAWMLLLILAVPMVLLVLFIAPYGAHGGRSYYNDGVFRLSRMFSASPSGALPYLMALWMAGVAGSLISAWPHRAFISVDSWIAISTMLFYYTGLWFFLWALARVASALLRGRSVVGARLLTLAIYTALFVGPLMVYLVSYAGDSVVESSVLRASVIFPVIAYPELFQDLPTEANYQLFVYGSALWGIGAFVSYLHERYTNRGQDVS